MVWRESAVMTATLDGVTTKKPAPTAEAEAAKELVRLAREQDLPLTGPHGLLKQLTKTVIEAARGDDRACLRAGGVFIEIRVDGVRHARADNPDHGTGPPPRPGLG
jgi:hypothetical protein